MSSRDPRFEVVHTGPRQFHARYRAANGQIVFTTETYTRRRAAQRAIWTIASSLGCGESTWSGAGWIVNDGVAIEVREVDERLKAPVPTALRGWSMSSAPHWISTNSTATNTWIGL